MQFTLLFIGFALLTFSSTLRAQTSRPGHSASHTQSARAHVPMGHTPYHDATLTKSKGESTSHSKSSVHYTGSNAGKVANNSKTYHPGVTHSMALAAAEKEKKKSSEEAARKEAEKKKAQEKKRADAGEFKSANRLISPPKPKAKKPTGPFVSE